MTEPTLPGGFIWIARTGDDLRFVHAESGKIARVSSVAIAVSSGAEAVQGEVNYAAAKLLREYAKDQAHEASR